MLLNSSKGGGKNIAPQPVMEVEVRKLKDTASTSRSDLYLGLSQMANVQTDKAGAGHVETKLGKFQVGSFLSCQVPLTESKFEATVSINCISRLNQVNNEALNYPRFPLRDIDSMVIPDNLCKNDLKLLQSLTSGDNKNQWAGNPRKQSECSKWNEERKCRFKVSQYRLISK